MDLYDLPFLLKKLKSKMSIHSETFMKIPHNYEMRFPKSLKDESDRVHNKVLNSYLSEIEEADYKKLLPVSFKKWFLNQNEKYHSSEIFNHDNLKNKLKNLIPPDHVMACGFLINSSILYSRPAQDGETIEVSPESTSHGNFGDTDMLCAKGSGGYAGDRYNQIAVRVYTSTQNWKLGVYSDSAGSPDDLIAPEIAASIDNSYSLQSITEFELTDSTPWIACKPTTDNNTYFKSGGNLAYISQSYAASFPDPITTIRATATSPMQCKIGHT